MAERRNSAKKPAARSTKPRAGSRKVEQARKAAAKSTAPKRQSARQPSKPKRTKRPAGPARRVQAADVAIPAEVLDHFGGQDRVDLIRDTIPEDATGADLLRLLAEAVRLGADPLRGDVYLGRGFARDGGEPGYDVVAKRDTLLRYAERHADFLGHDSGAIYEDDEFRKGKGQGDAMTLAERAGVEHSHGMPSKRGKLVGAWAAVEKSGRPPILFVADCDEYLPDLEQLDHDDPRRMYPDRYMVKAAMCWPLRMLYSLNDVVGAEELRAGKPLRPAATSPRSSDAPAASLSPFDEAQALDETDSRVLAYFREAATFDAGLWPRAKVRARLLACQSDEDREALADEMNASLAEHRAQAQVIGVERARARLEELRAFDPEGLDAEALTEYRAEVAQCEAALEGAGTAAAAA